VCAKPVPSTNEKILIIYHTLGNSKSVFIDSHFGLLAFFALHRIASDEKRGSLGGPIDNGQQSNHNIGTLQYNQNMTESSYSIFTQDK
jgi:hypothetical protein